MANNRVIQPMDDIILAPGISVRIKNKKGEELIKIGVDKTIAILGETFCLEEIKNWLGSLKSDACKCSISQLMNKGCTCNGS